MKRLFAFAWCLVALLFVTSGWSWAGQEQVLKSLIEGRSAITAVPLPSSQMPDLTVPKAYELQKTLIKTLIKKGEAIGGFKAGLTSPAGQKAFGVNQPLLAPLFKSGALGPDATVDTKRFVRPFIETEVGYVAGRKIDKPVSDVASLKKMISEVFPAVELPDIRFNQMKGIKGADIVADAIGSSQVHCREKTSGRQGGRDSSGSRAHA